MFLDIKVNRLMSEYFRVVVDFDNLREIESPRYPSLGMQFLQSGEALIFPAHVDVGLDFPLCEE